MRWLMVIIALSLSVPAAAGQESFLKDLNEAMGLAREQAEEQREDEDPGETAPQAEQPEPKKQGDDGAGQGKKKGKSGGE